MSFPKLHTDSLQLNAKATGRPHSELKTSLMKGIDLLMKGGLVVQGLDRSGVMVWRTRAVDGLTIVAEEFTYTDSVQRTQKALRFSSWMCLALALKLTREADRQALMDAVAAHPIY